MISKLPFDVLMTAGVCMKVRFKSKVTRGFSVSCHFATHPHGFMADSCGSRKTSDQDIR